MMIMIRKMGRSLGFKKIVLIRGGEMNDMMQLLLL